MSYANLILYSSVIPSYDDGGDETESEKEPKNQKREKSTQGLGFKEFMGIMKGIQ